ncbi:MAG TPA: hypothetical protein VFV90_06105, partial [Usitatibacter sp.]|nr:hypothetical protein [Usitatibacter sp.]
AFQVYVREAPLAQGASMADYRAFDGLAVVALVLACLALWKLCGYLAPESSASIASSISRRDIGGPLPCRPSET